jgi:hypothetical protein
MQYMQPVNVRVERGRDSTRQDKFAVMNYRCMHPIKESLDRKILHVTTFEENSKG